MIDTISGKLLTWGKPTARGVRFAASVEVPRSCPFMMGDDPVGRARLTRTSDGVTYRLDLADVPQAKSLAALTKGGVQFFAEPIADRSASDGWSRKGRIERVHLWAVPVVRD